MDQAKLRSEQVSGVPNVTYDLVALFYNKLEGISALEGYKQDAQSAGDREVQTLFEELQQTARGDVERLRGLLAQRLSG